MIRRNRPLRFERKPKPNKDQDTLNSLLWRIVMNQGGTIRVRHSELMNIPKDAGIKVDNVPGTEFVEIKAVVNSPIATPTRRIIT